MNKTFSWVAILLGIVFVALAAFYWLTPAGMLPAYFPGYLAGSTEIHFKHGLASLILALGLFAFAWFQSGPAKSKVSMPE